MIPTIRKIIAVLRREEKKRLGVLLFLDLLISITDIVFLALLLWVIRFYTHQGDQLPGDHGYPVPLSVWFRGNDPRILISFFLLLFAGKSAAGYYILQTRYRFVYRVASRMSEENLLRYLEGQFKDYVNIDSAVHLRRISQQPIEFCHHLLAGLMQAFTEGALIVLTIAGIWWYDPRLFLLLLTIVLPAMFTLRYLIKKRLRSVRASVKTSGEKTLQYLQETLSGYVESNIYGKNAYFTGRFAGYQQNMNNFLAELQIAQAIPSRLIEVFAVFGLFVLISFHATAFFTLGAFMAAAYKIIPGMVKLTNIGGQMRTYSFTLDDWVGAERAVPQENGAKIIRLGQAMKISSIRFEEVGFGHNGQLAFNGLSFCMSPGDFTGISGLSGKGKTTLINLLLGFLEPDQGRILINEENTTGLVRKRNWPDIAYVKQQPFLLNGTLLHNITLGEKNFDEKRMRCALYKSGLEEWAGPFPKCLDKMITEHGKNISGGQRQRIAIARALYKDAGLILLDEPFNELDPASESCLLKHFSGLAGLGKMVVLITHHEDSFSFCNKRVSLHE
ncbi:ATP-binding cassette domain-containing protein [Flavitalea flava]